jgi:glycosyltransferase involved in cell wall biosynthesis
MGGGGSERQVTYLASSLPALGWTVHVAISRRGPNWERLQATGATIHELTLRGNYDWRGLGAMRRLVDAVQPDVIQTWLFQMDVLAGLAALGTRTPWVFSERASAAAYPASPRFLVRRVLGGLATAIVANSAEGEAYWQRFASRRYVVPNAVPAEEIAATRVATDEELGLAAGRPLVLFAGRFEPQKNLEILLPALDAVLAVRNVQAVCCGEGSLRPVVEAWVAKHRDGRAIVRGHLGNLWGAMKGAAVLVSPALFEGSPNVVLEAMAGGVPLVVSDIPEHREILDQAAAAIVPPRSVEALAAAIVSVLDDPAAAQRRAQVARNAVAGYTPPAVARRYDEIYRELMRVAVRQ